MRIGISRFDRDCLMAVRGAVKVPFFFLLIKISGLMM